ncbi:MAG TPA: formate dehydrogenase accessory sulfurtransferase FdhD [Acidimicrobiales bacterium]|nr:formate dehydrogenase accessory sulfurtransferase FdhD [Acidimicrobiales bacterium]
MKASAPAVAGLLLTGGRSRRFGSDKARIPIDGVPNAQRLADVLTTALDGPVYEVGPGHTSLPTAPEDRPGEGPLAAIAAGARALLAAGHDGPAVVLACDLPLADEALVRFLAEQPGTTVPVVDGRPQPLCARYDGPALAAAPRLVAGGARAVNALLDVVPLRLVDDVDPRALLDVDTPEDLARARAVRRPTTPAPVLTLGRTAAERPDTLVTEEPLELRVGGPDDGLVTVNVTMRTPGHDFELAVGWLLAEGVVRDAADVAAVRYCALGDDEPQRYNVVSVRLTRPPALDGVARRTTTTASCGVCGTATLDRLAEQLGDDPVATGEPVALDTLLGLPDALRASQPLFDRTGGLHGAGLFRADGTPVAVREDVGRHNAVDKLLGHALLQRLLPLHDHVLVLSGRVGYELVQKAAVARIPIVCAVGAPSSLAVETAARMGVTLLGFVRDGTANLYTHPERVRRPSS